MSAKRLQMCAAPGDEGAPEAEPHGEAVARAARERSEQERGARGGSEDAEAAVDLDDVAGVPAGRVAHHAAAFLCRWAVRSARVTTATTHRSNRARAILAAYGTNAAADPCRRAHRGMRT